MDALPAPQKPLKTLTLCCLLLATALLMTSGTHFVPVPVALLVFAASFLCFLSYPKLHFPGFTQSESYFLLAGEEIHPIRTWWHITHVEVGSIQDAPLLAEGLLEEEDPVCGQLFVLREIVVYTFAHEECGILTKRCYRVRFMRPQTLPASTSHRVTERQARQFYRWLQSIPWNNLCQYEFTITYLNEVNTRYAEDFRVLQLSWPLHPPDHFSRWIFFFIHRLFITILSSYEI